MGLLDMGGLLSSGPLSSPDAKLALAAGLLSGTGNLGANLSRGLLAAQSAAQQERANRQNDMQQLVGAYNLMKQQEGLRMVAAHRAGIPYQPNPMLAQMEARLNQLLGNPNLSSQGPTGSSLPAAPAQAPLGPPTTSPLPQAPGMAPPSNAVMRNPDYQPPAMPAPSPGPASGQQGVFGTSAFGIEPEEFMAMANTPGGKEYLDALVKQYTPQVLRQGDLVARRPDGSYGSVYQQPATTPGVLPLRDQNGQVTGFREAPGFASAQANIAGAKTTATKAAEAPFTPITVPGANRSVFLSQVSPYFQGGPNAISAPSGGAPPTGVARVEVTQPSRQSQYFGGAQGGGFQGSGLVGPDPVELAGATKNVEAAASERQKAMGKDYQSLSDANSTAQTMISRLQTMKALGPQAIMGAESQKRDFFNGLLSLIHVPGALDAKTAGDLVDKNAAQIALAIGAGSNGTDALRSLAQVANPSRHMTLEAFGKAIDSVAAPLEATQAKTQLLTQHFTGGDTTGYFTKKQAFEKAADPRLWELQRMTPDQQRAYISTLTPRDAQQLLQSRAQLKQMGIFQ